MRCGKHEILPLPGPTVDHPNFVNSRGERKGGSSLSVQRLRSSRHETSLYHLASTVRGLAARRYFPREFSGRLGSGVGAIFEELVNKEQHCRIDHQPLLNTYYITYLSLQ